MPTWIVFRIASSMPDRAHDRFHDNRNDLLTDASPIRSVFDTSTRQNFSAALIDHCLSRSFSHPVCCS
ncbi:hypothetical protein BVI2075_120098 [Burkholderia vietnamiensis]|nr:hypothetical protein BVI2075_120098 [Burkholderia vietnamiensis]CAG9222904.1 hypothetical protein BVI1335_430013 [Burkholderia vietnamiensis]